jgi:hypothetical protein
LRVFNPERWPAREAIGRVIGCVAVSAFKQEGRSAAVVLYIVLVADQTLGARIVEGKMTGVFPEYAQDRRTTGMFFPKLGRIGNRVSSSEGPRAST